MGRTGWLTGTVLAMAGGSVAAAPPVASAKVDFNRDVRPIISQHCFKCHGIDDKSRKGGVRLDVRDGALAAGESGKASVVPGKPGESELVKRILTADEDDVMPPASTKRVLTEAQKQTLKRWVEEGAEYQEHWAWIPPKQAALPTVKNGKWIRNAIDAFVLARLEAEGLAPSAEAGRHALIRRVSLDLIGLPPTPAEADAFAKDASPDAYEKLVDRLLASPQYGERWARKWLDLARYSDTNGYEKDRPRVMWPWRDWVINAINADMPFDRFTVEQLAGDMLPNATADQRVATGFHRNTMINEEGGIDPLEYRFHAMVDRVGTTGTTWLGLTVACAQCHTHKYDPIRHEEYFGIMAALDNADEPVMELVTPEIEAKRAEAAAKAKAMRAELPSKFPLAQAEWISAGGKLTTASGERAECQGDGSWRIGGGSGEAPDADVYTIEFETDRALTVDRLRVEALQDGSSGPGRTPHGNFVLTEVSVEIVAKPQAAARRVKLARAEADHSQDNFNVADAIDGKPRTGWGIAGQAITSRTATFHFDKPVAAAAGTKWVVKLEQTHGGKHTLVRPRISLGGKAAPAAPQGEAEQRKAAVAKAFAAWEAKQANSAARWVMATPVKLQSNAPTLTARPDGSVFVSGDITKSDEYRMTFALPAGVSGVTAVRVEALPDPSLPGGGPGKVHYEGPNGDFFLSEIGVSANGAAGKFVSAVQSFAAGKNDASKAIDSDQQSGWSINGGQGKAHHAVFVLDKPLAAGAREIDVRMLFEKYYAADIGRFRIWVSTDPRAGNAAPLPPEVETAMATPPQDQTAEQRSAIFEHWLDVAPELAEARKAIDAVRTAVPKPVTTLVMTERPAGHARQTHLYHRGEFTQPKGVVKSGVPTFLTAYGAKPQAGLSRVEFAKWLVSKENPLTARVTVNRQWATFFGRGIVRTTEDFGFQGELPSNQDLLDWLAVEFMNRGWSMKQLHRLIVTSSAYRQSSGVTPELLAKDPQNVLMSRGPRVRAEAEVIRDAMLKAAGLLSTKIGGPSVFPPQVPGVTTEGAYGPLKWVPSTGEDRFRRSLYTFAKRTAPFALYNTFDAPAGDVCVARREVSNTPLQALSLMNDEVFLDAARALGKIAAETPGDDGAKAGEIFRRVMVRPAAAEEVEMLASFAKARRSGLAVAEAKKVAGDGATDADAVERATWTLVARVVMNFDEAVVKD
ncbi:MAG TPA: PSD1 and planctomycete cytochrome C domain-containing protein [Tepidisphaeraceae bacterium]|nr:PSD1 and planctomycete cytochrome C domain-containing protein [Tepidisphaeraceae bacterium]